MPPVYSSCHKNVPIAERFFATTLMPPSFFWNINMTSGIKRGSAAILNQNPIFEMASIFYH
jgi:hypothetical protein